MQLFSIELLLTIIFVLLLFLCFISEIFPFLSCGVFKSLVDENSQDEYCVCKHCLKRKKCKYHISNK